MREFKVGDRVVTKGNKTNLLMTFGVYDGVVYVIDKITYEVHSGMNFLCLDGIYDCLNAMYFVHSNKKTVMFTLDAVEDDG